MTYIIRPNGDTDLSNATIHTETSMPQTISGLAAGTYEIGRIAWTAAPVDVTAVPIPVPAVATDPTIAGSGRIGAVQTGGAATWSLTPDQIESRWTRDGAAIPAATGTSYTPIAADDKTSLRFEQRAQKTGGAWSPWAASNATAITYAAPTAAAALAPMSFTEKTGIETCPTAAGFTGQALSFALVVPPTGVTIDAATGLVSVDTDVTGPLTAVSITVRVSNSGGQATSGFTLGVTAASAWSISGGGGAIVVAAAPSVAPPAAASGVGQFTITA